MATHNYVLMQFLKRKPGILIFPECIKLINLILKEIQA